VSSSTTPVPCRSPRVPACERSRPTSSWRAAPRPGRGRTSTAPATTTSPGKPRWSSGPRSSWTPWQACATTPIPTCPQCREGPRVPGAVVRARRAARDPGRRSRAVRHDLGWGITADANIEGAEQFVEYMMSDGYLRWLSLAPQGKFPVPHGGSGRAGPLRARLGAAAERRGAQGAAHPLLLPCLHRVLRGGSREPAALGLRAGRGRARRRAARARARREGGRRRGRGRLTPEQAARRAQADVERLQRDLG
jgi:multiple sugar transport system substrate-binding protein